MDDDSPTKFPETFGALQEAALDLYLAAKAWLAVEDTDSKRYTFAEIRALQALQAAVEKAERKS